MERLTPPHWEALTPLTHQAFERLRQLTFIQRFYLAGGTGLALHLGHRFSIDLDFFSSEPDAVGPDERAELRSLLDDPSLAITYDQDATFPVSATRGLAYFIDAEAQPMPRMLDHTPWSKMKHYLEHQALEVGRQRLADLWT